MRPKLKILHFITSLKMGGAEATLYNLLEYWKDNPCNNEHIVLFVHNGPLVKKIKDLGIKVFQVSYLRPIKLFKLVKKIGPDIIHSSLWSANIIARFVSIFYKIPLICDLHSDCRYHGFFRNFIEKRTINIPKEFVAVSFSVQKSFFKKSIVIQNGIDSEKLRNKAKKDNLLRKDIGLDKNDFVIGTVGRLHKIKRQDLLLKSFVKFVNANDRKAKLCIIGDGPERNFLEKFSHDLGIKDKVLFVGQRGNSYSYYPLFDCFVLSSESEGLSIALLEALSFGLPIVTTCSGDLHDVITHGVNGLLVPINNENSLAAAFEGFYTDKNMAKNMSNRNRTLAREKFDISNVANKYIELYKQIF